VLVAMTISTNTTTTMMVLVAVVTNIKKIALAFVVMTTKPKVE
jgi:hypothetical protein